MKTTTFLIETLAAAGMQTPPADLAVVPTIDDASMLKPALEERLRIDRPFTLAGHRSHSSHASHSSHRSSSGGGYRAPRTVTPAPPPPRRVTPAPSPPRNSDSTPPSSLLPSSPATAPGATTPTNKQPVRGNTEAFKRLLIQVQMSLYLQNYYNGAIDGIPGPQTSAAISRYQREHNMPVTGTINDPLLDALNVQRN